MAQNSPQLKASAQLKDKKQELFCVLFTGRAGRQFFNHAQNCYAEAYGYQDRLDAIAVLLKGVKTHSASLHLDEDGEEDEDSVWDDADGVKAKDKKKNKTPQELRAEAEKVKRVCQAAGSRLLRNVMVRARADYLLDQYLSNSFVDRERAKVIMQDHDLQSKMRAIESYDKLKKRVGDDDGEKPQKVQVEFSWEDPEPRPKAKIK